MFIRRQRLSDNLAQQKRSQLTAAPSVGARRSKSNDDHAPELIRILLSPPL